MRRLVAALALFALTCGLAPAALRLTDSGQTDCYDDSTSTGTVSAGTPDPETAGFDEQDCTRGAAAADALGRMAKVGGSSVPGRDYSKIANDGSVLPASAVLGGAPGDWACTRDNSTGLIWEIKTDDGGLRDVDWTYTWYDSNASINGGDAGTQAGTACNGTLPQCNTSAYRNAVNALAGPARLCGATDWRLPTANELDGLINAGAASFVIDTVWFPDFFVNIDYWTSETSAQNVSFAWWVNFTSGNVGSIFKSSDLLIRLVRGGQ